MLCSSCGHDNPRENRYCGMCGNSFPHRFLPVPEEQSALTFPIAPLEIAPSHLPVSEPLQPESRPTLAPAEAVEPARPVVGAHAAAAVPPSVEVHDVEHEPVIEVEEPRTPPPAEVLVEERAPIVKAAALVTAPEMIPVAIPEPPPQAKPEPVPDEPRTPVAETTPPRIEAPATVAKPAEVPAPPTPSSLPEIRRYATPHLDAPSAHVDTATRTPSISQRPPAPPIMEPPPDSAGMPTFQSVAEAAGAPPISPFEPPVAKDADEERELQEFVASFRYNPPVEAVDELTMRSEVPVLDAEAPVTPSHPSFDDDVPPPPEAGPHPTGEEYYPRTDASADRSRYLEIADTQHAGPSHRASTASTTSFLGLNDAPPDDALPPDEVGQPAPRRWLLWTSLLALLAIFGTLGYFEGRAQIDHALQGPIEIVREQYAKLRQRVSEMTASAPAATSDRPVAEEPAKTEPQAQAPTAETPAPTTSKAEPESSPAANPPASSVAQPTVTPDQQQPKPSAPPAQSASTPDIKTAAAPSTSPAAVAPQKPAIDAQPKATTDATTAKRESAIQPPPAVAKPKSKNDPGQQELANAMQASDPAAAAAWLWKATSRGNPIAPVRLADMYIKGRGVPRSCEQALVLLRSEAAKENAPARNRLAALYANGTCVARDRVRAYQLMSSALAVDPTSEWAEQNRKELLQQMTPEERAQAEKYR
ncbi:MAG TPA: hypothetical protein VIH91_02500 [Terriglobales bacterium]